MKKKESKAKMWLDYIEIRPGGVYIPNLDSPLQIIGIESVKNTGNTLVWLKYEE